MKPFSSRRSNAPPPGCAPAAIAGKLVMLSAVAGRGTRAYTHRHTPIGNTLYGILVSKVRRCSSPAEHSCIIFDHMKLRPFFTLVKKTDANTYGRKLYSRVFWGAEEHLGSSGSCKCMQPEQLLAAQIA